MLGWNLIRRSSAFLQKQNEIGRFLSVNAQTPDNPRLAYSISLWLGILDYARWRNTDLNFIHRVKLSRANMLMPLLRLMQTRATELFTGAMMKCIISAKLHRKPVLAEGWRLSISVRPPRRSVPSPQWDIINLKGRSPFFLSLPFVKAGKNENSRIFPKLPWKRKLKLNFVHCV